MVIIILFKKINPLETKDIFEKSPFSFFSNLHYFLGILYTFYRSLYSFNRAFYF